MQKQPLTALYECLQVVQKVLLIFAVSCCPSITLLTDKSVMDLVNEDYLVIIICGTFP